jgi:ABC-type dipeptide/oligopeptide/nickel transport system ATPase subunit
MRDFVVNLKCEIPKTFLTTKAAQSQDINIEEKSTHEKHIHADIDSPFNIGLIVGASGSGKTTLARQIYGGIFDESSIIDQSKPIIDQFPDDWTYEQIQTSLCAIGLTSVPCWIRPAYTLSNGQKFRAEVALKCAFASTKDDMLIIDEWTSVVDRIVGKIMSHSVQKFARKFNKKIVLLSCHYDVIDWLLPDWIIDCNKDLFEDRRLLQQERSERLTIDVREIGKSSWKYFSKYHYLSHNLPGGRLYFFGAFIGKEQIGFNCFAHYIPGNQKTIHSNRTVIHPDYCGIGLGMKFDDATCQIMKDRGFKVLGKFSSIPTYKAISKNPKWRYLNSGFKTPLGGGTYAIITKGSKRFASLRNDVRWWSFEYIGVK